MKKLYSTLLILLVGFGAFAQNSQVKKANKLYLQRAYMEASEQYRLVSDKNQEVLEKLGDSYYFTNRMKEAEDTYSRLFDQFETIDPMYKFRYSHALRAVGKNDKAAQYLGEYLGEEVNWEDWTTKMDTAVSHTYTTNQVMQNAASSDFGITFMGDKVVFASTRNSDRPIYRWNNKPYLDLYEANISDDGKLTEIELFGNEINTDTHESSAAFSDDGNVMYFDRTNERRVKTDWSEVPVATIRIYRAEKENGEWTNIEELPFTSDQYSTEHPTLSQDGKTLYFASDMPGSLGSFDIYKVAVNEDGTFGEPVNLGPNVNTANREQFPYIANDGTLYFATDGRIGFGNLDIFKAEAEGTGFSEAQNLGNTLNSEFDDFAYVLKEGEEKGYLASNRRGSDNLYAFSREEYKKPVLPKEEMEINPETGRRQIAGVGNIYFDFDKATIKPESEPTLNRVVEIMKNYPMLKIEIGSHADARGSDKYNMDLSQRRAESTLEYLVTNGISRDRLVPKGYGEEVPLNDCTQPTGCTNEQYAKNRRSEFTEITGDTKYFQDQPEAQQQEEEN
ncbi:peptidoglycan-associated lipoprotein [Salinimicrobium sediminis]|uniref:Peptidoglycan-associated lipoprotein n=1 Tax=Salinimicrobium sediminis TaxID=1343891 RepID=A0A285X7G0_9FLAO|nr:OmpA family protein [Salinimicrobium sediminis]SOC80714.1 peptidoglycan-associated lipoprotein [Salinimicrobium sediminis]